MSKYKRLLRLIALDGSLTPEVAEKLVELNAKEKDGGPGSGNFGHKGRPGKKGGSAKEGEGGGAAGGSSESAGSEPKPATSAPQSTKPMANRQIQGPTLKENGAQNPNSMEARPTFSYRDLYKEQTGESLSNTSAQRVRMNKQALSESNMEMADVCFERAKQWPEGSKERKIYNNYAETLSKPLSGRPTPEQSKEATQKKLANISNKLQPYAVERYKRDLANEPQITSDICDIAEELGTGMFGLDYRLKGAGDNEKGVCRIAEKIQQDMEEAAKKGKRMTYEQAVDKLGDLVRYTQACTTENLVDNANKTLAALEKKGYKVVKVKNTWESFSENNPYRGVNCSVVSPTGTKFELQFHTAESLVGKEVQHEWYEEARTESTPEPRKAELNKRMYENAKPMKAPRNIHKLQSRTA